MQAWLTWIFISRQVRYWSDVWQTKRSKQGKKKELKKKGKEQKKPVVENESEDEAPLVNGKEKVH
jgi:predicted nucleic acid binding AN1-type Zn finger protein